ncbi:hypothetical protein LINPERHAP2_LOCUS12255 [Linum perenne]
MLPLVEHRCCVRHLYVNFSGKFGRFKHLKDLLWGASRSTYKAEFNSWMALIEKESSKNTNQGKPPRLSGWLGRMPSNGVKLSIAPKLSVR